jgi:hypothetical protein
MSRQAVRALKGNDTRQDEDEMNDRDVDNGSGRGEVLVQLRHGIRHSARLAEELAGDAIVGNEARGLLGRLAAIRAELDALAAAAGPDLRRAHNDPFWSQSPNPFRRNGSS